MAGISKARKTRSRKITKDTATVAADDTKAEIDTSAVDDGPKSAPLRKSKGSVSTVSSNAKHATSNREKSRANSMSEIEVQSMATRQLLAELASTTEARPRKV